MWINRPWENFEAPSISSAEKITQDACKQQKEAFQESFESALRRWIEILNEEWFTRLQSMLKENLNIDISNIHFKDLNKWTWVFIKLEDQNTANLWVYNLNNPLVYGTNLVKLWVIENSKFDEYNWIYTFLFVARETRVKDFDYSLPKEEKCDDISLETWKKENIIPPTIEETEILAVWEDRKHEIKKWDNLWKIVESYYDVSSSENKNRDIANIILKLNRLENNKWVIQNNGAIFIWKTLHLPHTITTTRKWGHEKDFSLKNQEA